jgi:HAD superfamily hydrolase (TIGR01549 family)
MAVIALGKEYFHLEAIGIDVDGVMRDTAREAYDAVHATLRELGGHPQEFSEFVHDFDTDYLAYYRSRGVKHSIETIHEVYDSHVRVHDESHPYADVKEFLDHAHYLDLKVFTVSSHPSEHLRAWFDTHGMLDHMMCIRGGSTDKRACLARACDAVGSYIQTTCYIGDWGLDMRAARAAGAVPIGITRSYDSRTGLIRSGAAHVVDDLRELKALLVP